MMSNSKNFKFYLDARSDLYDFLKPLADKIVYDFETHDFEPNVVYLIGSHYFSVCHEKLREIINNKGSFLVLEHVREGGDAMTYQFKGQYLPVEDLVLAKKLPVIGGGAMTPEYQQLVFENFLVRMHLQIENKEFIKKTDLIFSNIKKPYKFLFLNGRARYHRKYLLERFTENQLLEQAIWSNLESYDRPAGQRLSFYHGEQELIDRKRGIKYLPRQYEYPFNDLSIEPRSNEYVKFKLFQNQWRDGTIYPPPYIDTFFSVVTETEFDSSYSFRTEKIWKPIMIGHPWICVSGQGFYQDLKNLGFRSFDHLIDEKFDQIDDPQQRIQRVAEVIEDLCKQDLSKFLAAAKDTCKYNQQHFLELYPQILNNLPNQFVHFINQSFKINE